MRGRAVILISQVVLLFSVSALSSCTENPCEYKRAEYVKMSVTEIEEVEPNQFEIYVSFNKSSLAGKPVKFTSIRNCEPVDSTFIKNNRVSERLTWEGYVADPVNLDCAEPIVSFENRFF